MSGVTWPKRLGQEFHDLEDVALNMDAETGELQGSWGNLGYWQDEQGDTITQYSLAAEMLAQKLGEFAQLNRSQMVLDVGFGCGDQIQHWHKSFSVTQVYGLNISRVQTDYALKMLSAKDNSKIHIQQGDACDTQSWLNLPLKFDRIIGLDCVYHFADKPQFFQLCASRLLNAEGEKSKQLVLSDLILAKPLTSIWQKWLLKCICYLSHIPFSQIQTLVEYEEHLSQKGLRLIEYQDISQNVMPGFSRWVFDYKGQLKQVRKHNHEIHTKGIRTWIKYIGTAWFLRWVHNRNVLRYLLLKIEAQPEQ